MPRFTVFVHFNDQSSIEVEPETDSALEAVEKALRTPEVWRQAFAVTHIEVEQQ